MRFKIGDKVNFLNENGGGVVVKILDSRLVQIETEDGFEIPVLATELIKDHRAEPTQENFNFLGRKSETPTIQEVEEEPDNISEINPWGKIKEEKGIYLAFEPHEKQWVLTGKIDIHILNHTSNDILYSLFMEVNQRLEGIDFNSVPADSKITIATIDRDEIEDWISGYIQILFHNDLPSNIYYPIHSEIDLKINRFFKEGSYRTNTLTQGRALIVSIAPENTLEVLDHNGNDKKYGSKTKAGIAEPVKERPLIDKYKQGVGEAIIDLHIGELLDNILGLSSLDMLTVQLDYFKKTLESAMKNDYTKVTFIHGVGNGVLKNNIIKELNNYSNTENQMAAISKFGVGAIDVIITSSE